MKRVIWLMMIPVLLSCASGKQNEDFGKVFPEEIKNWVTNKNFEIENNWLHPLSGGQVNLMTNPNYIRMHNDSLFVDLPYYGIRRFGGGYPPDGGIRYEGLVTNFKSNEELEKQKLNVSFEAIGAKESFTFVLTVFSNKRTILRVISNMRDVITYRGFIEEWKENNNDKAGL